MILRRSRFRDLVTRQLEVFADGEADALADAARADAAWTQAAVEETEERYGDYQLLVDAIGERLYEVREAYARTLGEDAAAEYRAEFVRAARKRFPRFAAFLEAGE